MTAQRVDGVSPFLAMEVLERAQQLERQGTPVIHLELGEPDFATPACIRDAAVAALDAGYTHYTHSLGDCDLREARACGATFDKAHLRNCRLDGLAAQGATFTETWAAGQDFSGCADLSACHFLHAELERARFSRAPLSRATFEACRLAGADFAGCPMQNARIYSCRLDSARFFQADLSKSSWLNCEGAHLVLREATLTEASLETCRLVQSDLSCLSARGCRFLSCDLHGCDMRASDLLQGALRDCKLGSADLRGASLFAADLLYMAVNEATRMDDCNLDRTCLRLLEALDVCGALALTQNGTTICRAVTDWIAKHPEDFDDEGDLAYLEEKYQELQDASNKMLAVITEKKRKQLQLT